MTNVVLSPRVNTALSLMFLSNDLQLQGLSRFTILYSILYHLSAGGAQFQFEHDCSDASCSKPDPNAKMPPPSPISYEIGLGGGLHSWRCEWIAAGYPSLAW